MDTLEVILARIEEKMDGVRDDIKDMRGDHVDHESRIRAIERKLWGYSGAISLISAVSASSILYLFSSR